MVKESAYVNFNNSFESKASAASSFSGRGSASTHTSSNGHSNPSKSILLQKYHDIDGKIAQRKKELNDMRQKRSTHHVVESSAVNLHSNEVEEVKIDHNLVDVAVSRYAPYTLSLHQSHLNHRMDTKKKVKDRVLYQYF
jgi:UDP-N-acetylmuramyl tripeptide synthase